MSASMTCRVSWRVFETAAGRAEGQVFAPEQPTDKAILFCPGFPGAGATVFEQRHAGTLVEEGYAVIVLRHAGTRLDSAFAPAMVNNAGRLRQGRKNNETHLGGGPSTLMTWMTEPYAALQDLTREYKRVEVIGNSFGALSSMWSLTEGGLDLTRIGHLILLAGAQGEHTDDPETDVLAHWKPEYMTVPQITNKVTLDLPESILATLKIVYRGLPERVLSALPPHIPMTYIVVQRDEILAPGNTDRFRALINGRGRIVPDHGTGHPEAGLLAHDTPDYRTEDFLALLDE